MSEDRREKFESLLRDLESGRLRVAEKRDGQWTVNSSVKEGILEGFRLGRTVDMSVPGFSFFDKDTIPPRTFSPEDGLRIVPGGTTVRRGAYLAPGVIVMPPAYINIGAYVDSGSMVDSHAVVGSCAQVGKNVHLAATCQIGGVLEPAGALPVIIEDNAFIGGGCGIYEGTIVGEGAVIASGVVITRGTPIYDAVRSCYIRPDALGRLIVPPGAVVVSGSRPVAKAAAEGIQVYTPVILKYRDERTGASVNLEEALR